MPFVEGYIFQTRNPSMVYIRMMTNRSMVYMRMCLLVFLITLALFPARIDLAISSVQQGIVYIYYS